MNNFRLISPYLKFRRVRPARVNLPAATPAKPGRERYNRFIKALLLVGDKPDATYKKPLGMKLEVTPLENPYAKRVGDALRFKIAFDGKPLINRTVFADNRDSQTQKMTTDKNGIVTVKVDRRGM
jgi:uncharacterized GH25 family protein